MASATSSNVRSVVSFKTPLEAVLVPFLATLYQVRLGRAIRGHWGAEEHLRTANCRALRKRPRVTW